MLPRLLIAPALALALHQPATANGWDMVYLTSEVSIEVDRTRPIGKGNIRRAWLRWSFTKPRTSSLGQAYASNIDLTYVNCAEKSSVTVQSTIYSETYGKGETIRTDGAAKAPGASMYTETTPGTLGEFIVQQLCK